MLWSAREHGRSRGGGATVGRRSNRRTDVHERSLSVNSIGITSQWNLHAEFRIHVVQGDGQIILFEVHIMYRLLQLQWTGLLSSGTRGDHREVGQHIINQACFESGCLKRFVIQLAWRRGPADPRRQRTARAARDSWMSILLLFPTFNLQVKLGETYSARPSPVLSSSLATNMHQSMTKRLVVWRVLARARRSMGCHSSAVTDSLIWLSDMKPFHPCNPILHLSCPPFQRSE